MMKADSHVFPVDIDFSHSGKYTWGIEVRDYIAIQAMKAIISNTCYVPEHSASEVALLAYDYADELIKRSK